MPSTGSSPSSPVPVAESTGARPAVRGGGAQGRGERPRGCGRRHRWPRDAGRAGRCRDQGRRRRGGCRTRDSSVPPTTARPSCRPRRRIRPGRHRGEQRRHPARPHAGQHVRGGVGLRRAGAPTRALAAHARRGPVLAREVEGRPAGRRLRSSIPRRRPGCSATPSGATTAPPRGDRHLLDDRPGTRQVRGPGQCDRPGRPDPADRDHPDSGGRRRAGSDEVAEAGFDANDPGNIAPFVTYLRDEGLPIAGTPSSCTSEFVTCSSRGRSSTRSRSRSAGPSPSWRRRQIALRDSTSTCAAVLTGSLPPPEPASAPWGARRLRVVRTSVGGQGEYDNLLVLELRDPLRAVAQLLQDRPGVLAERAPGRQPAGISSHRQAMPGPCGRTRGGRPPPPSPSAGSRGQFR